MTTIDATAGVIKSKSKLSKLQKQILSLALDRDRLLNCEILVQIFGWQRTRCAPFNQFAVYSIGPSRYFSNRASLSRAIASLVKRNLVETIPLGIFYDCGTRGIRLTELGYKTVNGWRNAESINSFPCGSNNTYGRGGES
jgi:hypothetical protein